MRGHRRQIALRCVAPALCLALLLGCSVYKAATAPPPVAYEDIQVGAPRTEVLGVLGSPKHSDLAAGKRTELFEFVSGYHEATKSRVVLYIAGDLFTLGLAELIFWPMELAVLDGSEGRAVVTYHADETVEAMEVMERNGALLLKIPQDGGKGRAVYTADLTPISTYMQHHVHQLTANLTVAPRTRAAVLPVQDVARQGEATPLGGYFSDKIVNAFLELGRFSLIERSQLDQVIDELQLTHQGMFQEESAKRVGHLLGVDIVVVSTFADHGRETVEINSKVIKVETAEIMSAAGTLVPRAIVAGLAAQARPAY